jgi:hypothetical protein
VASRQHVVRTAFTVCSMAIVVALAGCSGESPEQPGASADAGTAGASAGDASAGTSDDASTEPAAGVDLEWATAGPIGTTVVTGGDTTVAIAGGRAKVSIGGAAVPLPTPGGYAASEALLDDDYAVVVFQEKTESQPGSATVIERATGRLLLVDGYSDVPTVNGGAWALGSDSSGTGLLFHATFGPKNSYCLAAHDLAADSGRIVWCAPQGSGFNDVRQTPAGLTVLSFTSGRPSCRTPQVVDLASGEATALAGPGECAGWDSLLLEGGAVWSSVPDEKRVEEATFSAQSEGDTVDLGIGDTGSLTWCAGAAYFTRPETDGQKAALIRWDGTAATTVYEAPGKPGFLSAPRCGGSSITLTARSEGGDEQVTAALD